MLGREEVGRAGWEGGELAGFIFFCVWDDWELCLGRLGTFL